MSPDDNKANNKRITEGIIKSTVSKSNCVYR